MLVVSGFFIRFNLVPNELKLYSTRTPAYKSYDEITWEYPVSFVNPYYIIRTVPESSNATIFSQENFIHDFEFIQKVLSRFKTHTTLPPT